MSQFAGRLFAGRQFNGAQFGGEANPSVLIGAAFLSVTATGLLTGIGADEEAPSFVRFNETLWPKRRLQTIVEEIRTAEPKALRDLTAEYSKAFLQQLREIQRVNAEAETEAAGIAKQRARIEAFLAAQAAIDQQTTAMRVLLDDDLIAATTAMFMVRH